VSEVPEYLPKLRVGKSPHPQQGGCLVQIANWLCDHDVWTDQPEHVHPVLQAAGIHVNDVVGEAVRRELALAVVRIAGTGTGEVQCSDEVTEELQELAYALFVDSAGCGVPGCSRVHTFWVPKDLPAAERVDRYFQLIDRFEELTEHQPRVVPEEEWAALAMVMAGPDPA
jgi:hypothetical protein